MNRAIVSVLALVLGVSLGLLIPAVGVGGQAINHLDVVFGTSYSFNAPGDNFTDSAVQGSQGWFSNFNNTSDASGQPAANLVLTLASDQSFDQIGAPPVLQGRGPTLVLSGPPLYRWNAGNVPQFESPSSGPQVPVNVMKNVSPVSFTPGFDVSRSADRTVFTSPGLQTFTLTVTPAEDISYLEIIVLPNVSGALKTRVVSPTTDDSMGISVSPDGTNISIRKFQQMPAGTPQTFVVTTEVTPLTSAAEFMPGVRVATSQALANGTASGSSVTRAVADVGTWTWSADGSYEWSWSEMLMRAVILTGYARDLTPAPTAAGIPASPGPNISTTSNLPPSTETSAATTTAEALQTPEQKTLPQAGSASLLALIMTAIFLLMSAFFNTSIKSNYLDFQLWIKATVKKLKLNKLPLTPAGTGHDSQKSHFREYAQFFALLLVNALINTFIKRPSSASAFIVAFIPSLVVALIVTLAYAGAKTAMSNHRYQVPAAIRMYWLGILIAILFVVFTWVLSYPPILIYGFVGGYLALSRKQMEADQQGKSILISSSIVLAIGVASFYARIPFHNNSTSIWMLVMDNILAKLCCGGLLGLLLYLLPFYFMDGASLKKWRFAAWLVAFLIASAAFSFFVIVRDNSLAKALWSQQAIGVYIFLGICSALGFGSWLIFLFRSKSQREETPEGEQKAEQMQPTELP